MQNVWQSFVAWLKAPFDLTDMSPVQMFLLVGIVIISAIMWRHYILRHILADY